MAGALDSASGRVGARVCKPGYAHQHAQLQPGAPLVGAPEALRQLHQEGMRRALHLGQQQRRRQDGELARRSSSGGLISPTQTTQFLANRFSLFSPIPD